MQQQTDLFFYRFHLLFIGLLAAAIVVMTSVLVTAIGSHSVLDPRTSASTNALNMRVPDSSNAVTAGAYQLMNGGRRLLLTTGMVLYGACHSITTATTHTGVAVLRGSGMVVGGIGKGTIFVTRGIGNGVIFALRTVASGIMFTVRIPGRMVGSVASGHAVGSIIRPADTHTVPVITAPSAAMLARMSAQERQEIADLQAAQIAANQRLDGTIVAGDPGHGGYPAAWDNAAQDSRLDSWGMYNRECVSYAAWKVYQTYGSMPYWGGVGNANEWPGDARRAGIPTGSTPRVHSVAISMRGYYGHAMWVEAVSGNMVYVSQYNYDLHGHYSEMWINGSSLTYIYFK